MAENQNISLEFDDQSDPVLTQFAESLQFSQEPQNPQMERLNFLKKRDELLRQNILICLSSLGMGNPTGGEYNRDISYCIDDPDNRKYVEKRTIEFIRQLSNYATERPA